MGENMINNKEEKFIKEYFDSFNLSSTSDDFTKQTMNKVLMEWSSQPISVKTKISTKSKVWIVVGSVLAVMMVYLFDIKNVGGETSMAKAFGSEMLLNNIGQLVRSISTSFSQIPALFYMVAIGITFLLALDKMIQRFVNS